MSKKQSNILFNFIAPVYALFYSSQKRNYIKNINVLRKYLNISEYKSIIDIGCGTGAMCAALSKEGIKVTGVDPATKMLNIGRKKKENKNIEFVECDTCEKLPFTDKIFDLSVASYVAHGLKPEQRITLYSEMSRLSKHYVIYYDYNEKRAWLTSVIEWFEHGDYFNFIKNVKTELNENFELVQEIKLNNQASWYVCTPK